MNCEQIQNWICLEDSGELSAFRRARLRAHLRQCRRCREAMDDLAALKRAARVALPDRKLDPVRLEPILAAARMEIQRNSAAPAVFRHPWLRPLALAAAILILLQVAVVRFGRINPPDDSASLAVMDWNDGLSVEIDVLDLELDRLMADLDCGDDLELMVLELLSLEGEET